MADLLETGRGPVIDDMQRYQTCTRCIEPPDVGFLTNEWEQQRQGVEDDVGFAILGKSLDLRALEPETSKADDAFDNNLDSCQYVVGHPKDH